MEVSYMPSSNILLYLFSLLMHMLKNTYLSHWFFSMLMSREVFKLNRHTTRDRRTDARPPARPLSRLYGILLFFMIVYKTSGF